MPYHRDGSHNTVLVDGAISKTVEQTFLDDGIPLTTDDGTDGYTSPGFAAVAEATARLGPITAGAGGPVLLAIEIEDNERGDDDA